MIAGTIGIEVHGNMFDLQGVPHRSAVPQTVDARTRGTRKGRPCVNRVSQRNTHGFRSSVEPLLLHEREYGRRACVTVETIGTAQLMESKHTHTDRNICKRRMTKVPGEKDSPLGARMIELQIDHVTEVGRIALFRHRMNEIPRRDHTPFNGRSVSRIQCKGVEGDGSEKSPKRDALTRVDHRCKFGYVC